MERTVTLPWPSRFVQAKLQRWAQEQGAFGSWKNVPADFHRRQERSRFIVEVEPPMTTYLELYIKAPDGYRPRQPGTERNDAQGRVRIDKAAFAELARGARYASVSPVDRIAQTGTGRRLPMTEARFYEEHDANVGEWMIRDRSADQNIVATADDPYWAEQVALALNAWEREVEVAR